MKIDKEKCLAMWHEVRRWRWTRVVLHVAKGTKTQDIFTHVAALTYSTVLSVVPLLALVLALGRVRLR